MEYLPPHNRRSGSGRTPSSRLRPAYDVVRVRGGGASDTGDIPVESATAPPAPPAADTSAFFHYSSDLLCILVADDGGAAAETLRLRETNPAWARLWGLDAAAKAAGRTLLSLVHPEDQASVAEALTASAVSRAGTPAGETRFSARFTLPAAASATGAFPPREESVVGVGSAGWRWMEWTVSPPDAWGRRYAVARDVTETREAVAAIRWQATHDPLTGLPNRNLLQDRMLQALASAARRGNTVAVLFLDIDRFKPVNDSLGHAAGDVLLQEIAVRMRSALRDEDTIARLGGDEFVVVLPQVPGGRTDALQVAQKLLHHISRPHVMQGHELYVTASVGISLFPQDGQTPDDLLQSADLALYRAKAEGRGCAQLYSEAGGQEALERLAMQSRLRQAVDRQEMRLFYQPQVSLHSGEVFGVEALMRWQNGGERGEAVSPAKFIPLAEETGLIVPLGSWAVREACRQAADWRRGGVPLRISVNLAPQQLIDPEFPEHLKRHLAEIGLPGPCMELELTESTFIHSEDGILDSLHRLKDMGIGLSVDDFGTGYSSLAYLRRFPIDGVKVDRSFIANLETSSADEAVVRAVIDLSHTLGMKVIAEGVETQAQYDRLRDLGCDAMQGFYFSAAVPAPEVPAVVASGAVSRSDIC